MIKLVKMGLPVSALTLIGCDACWRRSAAGIAARERVEGMSLFSVQKYDFSYEWTTNGLFFVVELLDLFLSIREVWDELRLALTCTKYSLAFGTGREAFGMLRMRWLFIHSGEWKISHGRMTFFTCPSENLHSAVWKQRKESYKKKSLAVGRLIGYFFMEWGIHRLVFLDVCRWLRSSSIVL